MNKNMRLIMRLVLGIYLAYIGGSLLYQLTAEKPDDFDIKIVLAVVFIAIGSMYAIWGIKKFSDQLKKEHDEQRREEAAKEAERKRREKQRRDRMQFRTAPMPAPSKIIKGTATIKGDSTEEPPAVKQDAPARKKRKRRKHAAAGADERRRWEEVGNETVEADKGIGTENKKKEKESEETGETGASGLESNGMKEEKAGEKELGGGERILSETKEDRTSDGSADRKETDTDFKEGQ